MQGKSYINSTNSYSYAGVVAHSLVVGTTAESPATGGMADAVLAAHHCAEAALRLIKAGNTNEQVPYCPRTFWTCPNSGNYTS